MPKALPDKGEIVLIRITKIMPHGAYCELTEYKLDAYLPISEIASGWIKNIHEFIKEGQSDAAKVVFIDPVKRAVDVSLKKATAKEKKDKINEYTLEKRAEKFFNNALKSAHEEEQAPQIRAAIAQTVQTYTEFLEQVREDKEGKGLLSKKLKDALKDIVLKNYKPKVYEVSYSLSLRSVGSKGTISVVKKALSDIEKAGVSVLYEGAPHYKLTAKGDSYPAVEGMIKQAETALSKYQASLSAELKKEGA